jgi:hypothetical protein
LHKEYQNADWAKIREAACKGRGSRLPQTPTYWCTRIARIPNGTNQRASASAKASTNPGR